MQNVISKKGRKLAAIVAALALAMTALVVAPKAGAVTLNPITPPATANVGVPYVGGTISVASGSGPYTYSVGPGGPTWLTVSSTGVIGGTPTVPAASTAVTIIVTDNGDPSPATNTATVTFSVAVSAATLQITTTSLPNGSLGNPYSATVTTQGGTAPYSFSVTPSGGLPTGLTGNASGGSYQITGTPTAAGSYTFDVNVSDSASQTAAKQFTIVIQALTISPSTLGNATVGKAYNQQLSTTGGTAPYGYTVTSGSLPTGMSLSNSGLLSGTPATGTEGNYNFSITVVSTNGAQSTQSYSLTVNSGSSTPTGTYAMTSGNGQTYAGSGSLTFTSNAAYSKFDSVRVDGTKISSSNYSVSARSSSSSTSVTLSSSYLSTLSRGTHTIEIVSTDGSASTTFKVGQSNNNTPYNPSRPPYGSGYGYQRPVYVLPPTAPETIVVDTVEEVAQSVVVD